MDSVFGNKNKVIKNYARQNKLNLNKPDDLMVAVAANY